MIGCRQNQKRQFVFGMRFEMLSDTLLAMPNANAKAVVAVGDSVGRWAHL